MRRATCLLLLLGLGGCETVPLPNLFGERSLDPAIADRSLTALAGDGEMYADTPAGTVARSWLEHLKRLGLPAQLDGANCVHAETPDCHRFTITVFTPTDAVGQPVRQTHAYLHW